MSDDGEETVFGSLLKDFRSSTQSTDVNKRPSLYVAPTLADRTPTSVHKRAFSDAYLSASSKRSKDDDNCTVYGTTPNTSKNDTGHLVPGSPWELRQLRGDLVVARAEVVAMERQIKSLHSLREVAEVAFKKEKDILYEQLEHEREKTRMLEKHIHELRLRESDSRGKLDEVKQELSVVRSKMERQVLELKKENTNLKDKLMDVERSSDQKVKEIHSQLGNAEGQLSYVNKQVEMLTSHLNNRDTHISQLLEDNQILEGNVINAEEARGKIEALERQLREIRAVKADALVSQEKMRNYLSMEEDNRLLRAKNKELHELLYGKLLLEEQVNSLKEQLQGVDEIQSTAARHAQENTQLRTLLDTCRELALETSQSQPPVSDIENYQAIPSLLKQRLEALWEKYKAAVDEKLETVNNWRESERKLDRLTGEQEKSAKQVEKLQTAHDQQASLIRRLQKKLLLISRERDSYRQQLDMFERDLTITPQTPDLKEAAARIESQERTIAMYRDMLEKLEEDLNRLQSSADASKWEEKLHKAEAERNSMAAERDKEVMRRKEVETQLDAWAVGAFRGNEQPRLLTIGLKDNPVRWAVAHRTAELNKLRAECKQLRARVRLLMLGDHEVTKNLEDQQQVEKELEELRNQVKSNEVKMLRLKEAFRNTSQEYRETIHMLMGYTVDRVGDQQYKLLSVYADSQSDYLMFKLNAKESLDLLETPFSRTLKHIINFHLKEQGSIPMFLSGLTSNLFHKRGNNSTVDKDTMSICSITE